MILGPLQTLQARIPVSEIWPQMFPGPVQRVQLTNPSPAEELLGSDVRYRHKHPEFLFAISKQIAQRLRDTTRKVSDLAFLDVTGRVARTLLDLCKEPDAMTHPDGMQIKITRQEIGRIVGCSREMVGRVLKDLEERELVSVAGKTMVVFGTR